MSGAVVVVPVRDGAHLLPACLAAVLPQAGAVGAEVVVVDDASRDGSADLAERLGARVLRLPAPTGPYAARNAGWRASPAGAVAFTDVRARPRAGWLVALLEGLAQDGTALAGGDVHALPGRGAAVRYVHDVQPLAARHGAGHPFLPFLPTCNLAVRRAALEAVDGFREVRSGGDLDLCWRVQLAGLGDLRVVDGARVDWLPRAGVGEVVRQWHRYGLARPVTGSRFAAAGFAVAPPLPGGRQALVEARAALRGLRRRPLRDWPVEGVDRLCQLAFWSGYRRSWRELRELPELPGLRA